MSKNNRGYVQDAWMYVTEPPVSCFLSPLSSPLPSPVLVYPLDYGAWGEFIRLGSGSCRRSDSRTWPLFSLQCLDVQTPEITDIEITEFGVPLHKLQHYVVYNNVGHTT